MKLLLIGGTVFLGRHLVDAALARGHEVTLFNRGRTRPDLFPDVERLTGNRDGDLGALASRSWDAVIDTCGYVPRVVRQSVEALKDSIGHYTFVSSISVYADNGTANADESKPVTTIADTTVEPITGESYGPLKALCEAEVQSALPAARTGHCGAETPDRPDRRAGGGVDRCVVRPAAWVRVKSELAAGRSRASCANFRRARPGTQSPAITAAARNDPRPRIGVFRKCRALDRIDLATDEAAYFHGCRDERGSTKSSGLHAINGTAIIENVYMPHAE